MRFLLFSLSLGMLLMSCNDESADITESGFPFEFRRDTEGITPVPGQVVEFQFLILNEDSVMVSSADSKDVPQILIPEDSAIVGQPANPVLEGLRRMSVGDCLTVYYPLDTVSQRPPGFDADDRIRYDLVLSRIIEREVWEAEQAERQGQMEMQLQSYMARRENVIDSVATLVEDARANRDFQTTPSGLRYRILEEGNGKRPERGQMVLVSYYGVLAETGEPFDDSFSKARPIDFPLGMGNVIPGWDEGIAMLSEKSRAVFSIPADLAYGEAGRPGIPPNSELLFYVQLEEVGPTAGQ